ncbi:MAG: glycyl-radical enzyme activating protein, partial [Clostridiales bacterium]|nr:glycyl-radical enzyme activating protein [Candidatus Coliplasma equi]
AQISSPERKIEFSLCTSCGKCVSICPTGALGISGKRVSIADIIETVKKDAAFYGDGGGLTVSGGEPTAQPKALFALLEAAKNAGISTAVETCGAFPTNMVDELCRLTDIFLFDIKDTDVSRLFENTGANMESVISNLRAIDAADCKTVLRAIMIPDVNMEEKHLENLADLYRSLSNCLYVELLPYHPYGNAKAERIGVTEPALYRTPEKDEILAFAEKLRALGVRVKCYGTEAF